ncbi:MAG: hypothetical protein JNJ45_04485 [Chthonomonas sp.]|nr:hypothetical protein [Chthonomonas sp.]
MSTRILTTVAAVAVLVAALPLATAQQKKKPVAAKMSAAKSTFQKDVVDFTTKFCVSCHTGKNAADGVDIPKNVKEADVKVKYAKLYRKLARYAGSKQMPPRDAKPQPKDAERTAFTKWISTNIK